jgi:hypothetical protein
MMNLYCAFFALFCSAYVFAEDRSAKPALPLPDDVASVSSLQAKQTKIDAALKEGDLDIACYGGPQKLTLTAGQKSATRIQWNIPISKLNVGDKIRVQLKSEKGANAGSCAFYKYGSTNIGGVVWTLNADGFYYSQLVGVVVAQSDLDAYATFVVLMQAFSPSGLQADTITSSVQSVCKSGYIDVRALKSQIDTMTVPVNLLNTLEIPFRGYSAMKPVKVKKDGTGDFTTIQQAINSVTDAAVNKQYDIQVYDDFNVTDLTQLWLVNNPIAHNTSATNPTTSIALVITKNWVHIRGMGSPKRLYVESPTTLAPYSFQNVQTIFPKGNVIINNFYVGIKGGRYAIHQESGGSKTSDDYHATTVYRDLRIEHKGNRAADGYNSKWASVMAQANGTTSGLKMIYINCEWVTVDTSVPYYSHSNANFDEPNELTFINCRMLTKGVFSMGAINPYWGDIGSGQKSTVKIIGCNFGKFSIGNSIRSTETELTLANKWDCGGAYLEGYGNTPFVANTERPGVLCFKTVKNDVDIRVTGGTAKDSIFGGTLAELAGATDAPGMIWGEIRIEEPGSSLGASQIFNLPYRLGNCANAPKTVIVTVGGTDYTITFNKNYMTADGSAYSWNTVPALSCSSILADINAAFPAVFTCSRGEELQTYSFVDCMEKGVNLSAATLKLNKGVVRDYSVNAYNAWRLSQPGEKAEGIAGQRINPLKNGTYFEGNIVLTHKTLIPASLVGLSATGGTFYKCSADGTFVETTTPSDATFVAMDNTTLRFVQ